MRLSATVTMKVVLAGAAVASFAFYACASASSSPSDESNQAADLVGDASSDCGRTPTVHPATGTTGPYCPFQAGDSGTKNCAPGLHCCDPGIGNAATCAESCPSETDASADFACDSKTECPSGTVCCLLGTVVSDNTACNRLLGQNVQGSACRTVCAAAEMAVCAQQSDCASGNCTAFHAHGRDLGFCK